jgi:hypothetical protein
MSVGAKMPSEIILLPSELREVGRLMAKVRTAGDGDDKDATVAAVRALLPVLERAVWHLMQPGADSSYICLAAEPEDFNFAAIVRKQEAKP